MPRQRPYASECPCNLPIEQQIKYFAPYIKRLGKTSNVQLRKKQFKKFPKCLTQFISECAGAILRRDVELTPHQYQRLSPFKNQLIFLSKSKPSIEQKREQFLTTKGGFLSILPILGSILTQTIIPLLLQKWQKR